MAPKGLSQGPSFVGLASTGSRNGGELGIFTITDVSSWGHHGFSSRPPRIFVTDPPRLWLFPPTHTAPRMKPWQEPTFSNQTRKPCWVWTLISTHKETKTNPTSIHHGHHVFRHEPTAALVAPPHTHAHAHSTKMKFHARNDIFDQPRTKRNVLGVDTYRHSRNKNQTQLPP